VSSSTQTHTNLEYFYYKSNIHNIYLMELHALCPIFLPAVILVCLEYVIPDNSFPITSQRITRILDSTCIVS